MNTEMLYSYRKEFEKPMMRSLSSAVAGLRSHQTKMDVIGNNIANVNTYGFKASRTTFQDVYYQNLSSGSRATTTRGGTNPTQIGYGSSVATIDILNTQSGSASTDRPLDVYIGGEGFLTTKDSSGNFQYTRLGNLGFDAKGNLIDSNGNFVQGFPMRTDEHGNEVPNIPESGQVTDGGLWDIKVAPEDLERLTDINITSNGEIIGVLEGDVKVTLATVPSWLTGAKVPTDTNLRGSVGLKIGQLPTKANLEARLGLASGDITNVSFGDYSMDAPPTMEVKADGTVEMIGTYTDNNGISHPFTATGKLENGKVVLKDGTKEIMSFEVKDGAALTTTASAALTVSMHAEVKTGDRGGNTRSDGPQPYTTGNITLPGGLEIQMTTGSYYNGSIGSIQPEDGDSFSIGALVLAKFSNAAGLKQGGSSNYVETPNSGSPIFVRPGLEGTGALQANYLEMSNVDISKEFTDMITTQRGFQANTRIVTVSDEMLQELVNLKR